MLTLLRTEFSKCMKHALWTRQTQLEFPSMFWGLGKARNMSNNDNHNPSFLLY